ncbi:TniQ family protein [Marinicella meishanensis]|uniref:TniQ family protein n=1 Tax=Marinicella meishanensis TaxID=2873263 RepID=UPI001CBF97E6|nr:TniQ family protein [Marinicella sp. NBU2979]
MRNLIIKPIIQQDESPIGYLLRASETNGWQGIAQFLAGSHIYDWKTSLDKIVTSYEHWSHVLQTIGINKVEQKGFYLSEPVKNKKVYVNFKGLRVLKNDLRVTTTSICPHCLKEDGYAQSIWDHRSIHICYKHKVPLIDYCQACGSKINWKRNNLNKCNCGEEFNVTDSPKVPDSYAFFIEDLFSNYDSEKLQLFTTLIDALSEFYHFNGITLSEYDLSFQAYLATKFPKKFESKLKHAVHKAMRSNGVHPRLSLTSLLNSKVRVLNDTSLKVIKSANSHINTKDSFDFSRPLGMIETSSVLGISYILVKQLIDHQVIKADERINNQPWQIQANSVNRLLKYLSKGNGTLKNKIKLEKISHKHNVRGNFIETIKQIANKKINFQAMNNREGILSAYVEKVLIKVNSKFLRINDVADLCQVHYENIRFAIHAGVIKKVDPKKTKGNTIFIDEKVAKAFNKSYVFAGVLAKQHGLNHTNISEKIMSLGIRPISGPDIDGGLTYVFNRKDIRQINFKDLANLSDYETRTGRKTGDREKVECTDSVSIIQVSEKLNISNSKVLGLLSTGTLKELKNTKRELRITKKSLNHILEVLNSKETVEISQASKVTGESIQAFYKRWINTDYVRLIDVGFMKFISKDDLNRIKKFKSEFITSEEGGKLTNTNRTFLPNQERLGKIKAAKILGNERIKTKFYSITDVKNLVYNNEFSFKRVNHG